MLCKKIEHIEAVYMSRPPMPAAPPTARSTTHRTIPQARSFERGSANRMRLISRNAHLCAQALCAGPSLHDGAGDKPRAHITVQITQEASQEKEKKYPGIAKGTMSAHRYGARLLFSGNAGSHTTRTQCSPQRRTNAHAHCSAGPRQTARTGSSNNARSSQIAARPSTPFSHILSDIDEKAESATKESVRIQ